ncbi:monovalent cation/H(+) antiporter subunit G [Deinococcus pimensis]|uniref:monovalent cation/H(+) antiporter subunit G n=1 Tax=Deinococcus pimensis TaxID=309888 RepID=UPI0004BCEAFA|nr:monovalent cation/H(+) antiporter subunit G [Deinococcus pimensis]
MDFVWWRDLPILVGAFFVLAAAVGVLRFPDLYSRLHASSKLVTLGSAGIFVGAMLTFSSVEVTTVLVAILAFQFLTTPLAAYMIAQAAYRRGLRPRLESEDRDEWGEAGHLNGAREERPPGGEGERT